MSAMTPEHLSELLNALPPLDGNVQCEICAKMELDVPAVLRHPVDGRALCAMDALNVAATNDISFADIELAVRIRRFFIAHERTCLHCFGPASRWCSACGTPICDAAGTRILRRSMLCEDCVLALRQREQQLYGALLYADEEQGGDDEQ